MLDNIKPRVVLENLRSSSSLPTRLHSCQSTPCSSKRNSSRKTSKGLNSTAITKAPKCGGLKSFRLGGKRCKAVGRFHQMHVCTCLWPHKPMCFSHSLGTSMQQSIQGLKQDPRLKSGACDAHFLRHIFVGSPQGIPIQAGSGPTTAWTPYNSAWTYVHAGRQAAELTQTSQMKQPICQVRRSQQQTSSRIHSKHCVQVSPESATPTPLPRPY